VPYEDLYWRPGGLRGPEGLPVVFCPA
jgi:hypothetical protein